MSMNQKIINSHILADLLNIKPKPGTFIQRLKHDMKDNNFNMDDQIILIKNDTLVNPFQNSLDEELDPSSMSMPMIYQDQEPSSMSMSMPMIYQDQEQYQEPSSMPMSMPMIYQDQYQDQEPLTCKENKMSENELIRQQQELIRQQQELITQQQEQLNIYKIENMMTNNNHTNHANHTNHTNHLPHKKHKKTVRFQLIPFHTKMSKKKTRRATPLPRRSSSLSQKFLKL